MGKISNEITMLNLLISGRKYSVKELANILEVTPRMIRKYKEDLDKAGIYVDTIMGPYGGYVLNQNIKTINIKFNKRDVELLDKVARQITNSDLKEQLNDLIIKINSVYKEMNNTNDVSIKETNDKYNLINNAIKNKKKIKINYYSYNKGNSERIIDPIELFLFKDGWYVAGYCELRKDIRHFELKRISNYELLDINY